MKVDWPGPLKIYGFLVSVRTDGTAAGLHLFEEPDHNNAAEAEQRQPAEEIDERPVERLALELSIDHGLRRVRGVVWTEESRQSVSCRGNSILQVLSGTGKGVGHEVLMGGATPNK